MKGRKPTTEEEAHMAAVRELGCIVCHIHLGAYSPAEIHHIRGKTAPGAHFDTLALCYHHHRGQADCEEFTSRHPFKARFEARYGSEMQLLRIQHHLLMGVQH